ncbi:hypothetical protein HOLleu_12810 [Holothuria leucospilota]|uniref:Uncharacterized protein n=1 Tax=Holothuria leucospilota TaxID=206669 RepID=A0A9Q1CC68_HOLLE|nr:hypothetical protein HOLleu_12810 [Holothuria leucospilota]
MHLLILESPQNHRRPNNPERPIVSSWASPTTQISRFVDYYPRQRVQASPSHIQDTTHFNHINQINQNHLPFVNKFILVIADATSLYTNILHNEGVRVCTEALEYTRTNLSPPTHQLIRLLELMSLTLNNFYFNGNHFLQIKGTALSHQLSTLYAVSTRREGMEECTPPPPPIFELLWRSTALQECKVVEFRGRHIL